MRIDRTTLATQDGYTNQEEKNMNTTKQITVTREIPVATVSSFPDEVKIDILALDGIITPDQAIELAALLTAAAVEAPTLDWEGDDELKIVKRDA